MDERPVLVTGSTGYVGGRLVPRLLEAGHRVRAVGRSMEKLRCRPWAGHSRLELAQADVLDSESLKQAVSGCRAVFYLVHSMVAAGKDYASKDRQAAQNMAQACAAGGGERIIYLGGLGDDDDGLSDHLRSRTEVGRILGSGPVPATFLRAAMILGSGSASFELLRYLAERLPLMVAPRWVRTEVQPIAIRNVLGYLIGCLDNEATAGRVLDIGGPDVVNYAELFQMFAQEAGLPRRIIIPVPVFTPRLSSYWIHLVTPVPASIARPLAEGLKNRVVAKDESIRKLIPQELLSCRMAIRLSLEKVRQQAVETCWTDAGELLPPEWPYCDDAPYGGGAVCEFSQRTVLQASPNEVWEYIRRIGGETGWYYGQVLWRIRGAMDRLVGGVGLRRGRRHPHDIRVGDALDFWRVLRVEEGRRLILLAEMKLPGEAALEFQLVPLPGGRTELRQMGRFLPRGLCGLLYWYSLLPMHNSLYAGMAKALARAMDKPILEGPVRFHPTESLACDLPKK